MTAKLFVSLVEITLTEDEMVVREHLLHESIQPSPVHRIARRRPMPGQEKEAFAKIVQICSGFAEDCDWRFSASSGTAGDGSFVITLSENETALHVGSFIGLTVRPTKDTIELKGGCFNMYYQPATVYEEFVPISGPNAERLEKALTDMQHRLQKYYRNYVRV